MSPGIMNGDDDTVASAHTVGKTPAKAAATASGTQFSSVDGEAVNHTIPTVTTTPPAADPEARSLKQHRASVGKKVTARTAPYASKRPSLNSLNSQVSGLRLDSDRTESDQDNQPNGTHSANSNAGSAYPEHSSYTPSTTTTEDAFRSHQSLWTQVYSWLQQERAKLAAQTRSESSLTVDPDSAVVHAEGESGRKCRHHTERSSALDQLERILLRYPASAGSGESVRGRRKATSANRNRLSAMRALRRGSTSDSDYAEVDRLVPSADVVLDNSKTLLYSGGEAEETDDGTNVGRHRGREYWLHFKSEILRLTHTLGLKGWRRIPLDAGGSIEVVRLSGALTNAVYVVSPPKDIFNASRDDSTGKAVHRKPPPKLLLRIYGPQVEHLIDREHELRILRRLAKKNIGPSVLGTFKNGRFEEYFHAVTLTYRDLRIPETSKQIAKRMRELHEAIELLPEERAGGPSVWKNWDKWVARCEQVTTWLDSQISSNVNLEKAGKQPWRKRGYVCCVPWSQFREAVEKYRKWLDDVHGGPEGMKQKLVFAHNDTQYGNLLRLEPSGESPLLLPANEHKQLVVIDFEYASANTRAFEFANHFTEWCYNYHDAEAPWACHTSRYPTVEEQERFIRAYLKHRWAGGASSVPSSSTATTAAINGPATYTSSPRIPPFNLDLDSHIPYTPLSSQADQESREHDGTLDAETAKLLREVRLWRVANSAQWVAWGIVQAKIPGLEEALAAAAAASSFAESSNAQTENDASESSSTAQDGSDTDASYQANHANLGHLGSTEQVMQEVEADEAADEFDYLAYAQDRALFFWADLMSLGLVKEEDFPEGMVNHIKKRMIGR
ncbi:hypothetical protein VTO42DRAFT_5966 [Malbranchea cinnamomea]